MSRDRKSTRARGVELRRRGGSLEGAVAGTLGRLGAAPTAALVDPGNFVQFLSGLEPEEAGRVIQTMQKQHPEALEGVAVNLGGTNLWNEWRRTLNNKKLTPVEKAIGVVVAAPFGSTVGSLSRADHYNAYSDAVTSFSGNPHVLEHELGHAIDWNKRKGLRRSLYSLRGTLAALAGGAVGGPIGAAIGPQLDVLGKEYQASRIALQGTAPESREAARNILAPAYGSYVGGAAGALATAALPAVEHLDDVPTSILRDPKMLKAALPLLGILGGHAAVRTYNILNRGTGGKKKVAEEKRPSLGEVASRAVAGAGLGLAGAAAIRTRRNKILNRATHKLWAKQTFLPAAHPRIAKALGAGGASKDIHDALLLDQVAAQLPFAGAAAATLPVGIPQKRKKRLKQPKPPKPKKQKFASEKEARVLTAKGRKQIDEGNFALPGRRYPIHDASHARNALARVSQYGTPEEKAQVRAAVARKYPGIGKEKKAMKSSHRVDQAVASLQRKFDALRRENHTLPWRTDHGRYEERIVSIPEMAKEASADACALAALMCTGTLVKEAEYMYADKPLHLHSTKELKRRKESTKGERGLRTGVGAAGGGAVGALYGSAVGGMAASHPRGGFPGLYREPSADAIRRGARKGAVIGGLAGAAGLGGLLYGASKLDEHLTKRELKRRKKEKTKKASVNWYEERLNTPSSVLGIEKEASDERKRRWQRKGTAGGAGLGAAASLPLGLAAGWRPGKKPSLLPVTAGLAAAGGLAGLYGGTMAGEAATRYDRIAVLARKKLSGKKLTSDEAEFIRTYNPSGSVMRQEAARLKRK